MITKGYWICGVMMEGYVGVPTCVYRSPSENVQQFLRLFDIMLMSLYRPKTEFFTCADVNIDCQMATGNNNSHNYWFHICYTQRISLQDFKITTAQLLIIFL